MEETRVQPVGLTLASMVSIDRPYRRDVGGKIPPGAGKKDPRAVSARAEYGAERRATLTAARYALTASVRLLSS